MSDVKKQTILINRDFEEKQAQETASSLGIPYIAIAQTPINPDVLALIPADKAVGLKVIPFAILQKRLSLAAVFPQDPQVRVYLDELKKTYEVDVHLCSQTGFQNASAQYQSQMLNRKTVETRDEFVEKDQTSAVALQARIQKLEADIGTMQAEVALNEILLLALERQTSDVHIQPDIDHAKVRFRLDGILRDMIKIPFEVGQKLVARIKYESGTKSNVKDVPQDGRMGLEANNRKIDIRVSVIPTPQMESITLRILDMSKSIKDFPSMGFEASQVQLIHRVLQEPNGLILITGPTGSGKTTTLYTMLHQLNTPDRKLVTLEDPIEYRLPNITQSQIEPDKEYDFERGLKAMLRHDPDVILVGEIRDYETAKLASEASQTGHLVLSTLHTNTAMGAISRLRNLGVQNYNIASSIKMFTGQRLVRTLCPHCRKKAPLQLSPAQKAWMQQFKITVPEEAYEAGQCEACHQTGYAGRTVISEFLLMDHQLSDLITQDKPEHEIRKIIYESGHFKPLWVAGLEKVIQGVTSKSELMRVVSF